MTKYHFKPKADEMSLLVVKAEINLRNQFNSEKESVKISTLLNLDKSTGFYRATDGEGIYQQLPLFKQLELFNSPTQPNKIITAILGAGINPCMINTHYISADRIDPQEVYKKSPLSDFPHVGSNGEMAVNLLSKLAEQPVNSTLFLAETPGFLGENQCTLLAQTQAWLGKILAPLSLKINPLQVNLLELLVGNFKPSNVGFGYSSILPIIVTGLIAKPDDKIIIENPEIHLHPKAQTALMEFLVMVANTGVQIFIESHSDHTLNALRLATKNKLLTAEDTSVLFFKTNTSGKEAVINPILIDEKGKLYTKSPTGAMAGIPKGFFDEWTNTMAKLFRNIALWIFFLMSYLLKQPPLTMKLTSGYKPWQILENI